MKNYNSMCFILTCCYPCSQGCHTDDQNYAALHVASNLKMALINICLLT